MAKNKITVGIDIGTTTTRCVVLSWQSNSPAPETLTAVAVPTKGVRHGYIVNLPDVTDTITRVVALAQKESGITIKKALFSMGGTSLLAENASGSAIITKSDGEVTALDIKKALLAAEEAIDLKNRRVIYTIPVSWKLDGKDIPGKPDGMHGVKLEAKVFFVTCLSQHLEDLLSASAEAGIEVVDVVPSSIAASSITLSGRQKAVGVMLVNIGAETVSIAVFENNAVIGLTVFPIGSTNITNDIALGFRISLEEAESLKTGNIISNTFPKHKVDEIVTARLSDIFELIDGYLKKIRRSALLPAGVVITGGGSGHTLVEGLARDVLRLPSRVGAEELLSQMKGPIRDSSWFVAYGLAIYGKDTGNDAITSNKDGDTKGLFKEFLRQFLP